MRQSQLADPSAVRLSAQELRELANAGSITQVFVDYPKRMGWTKRWANRPDGSTTLGLRDVQNRWTFLAEGTWRIREDGAYCVDVQWKTSREQWCRGVYRVADGLYLGRSSKDPDAMVGRLTFEPRGGGATFADADWIGQWTMLVHSDGFNPSLAYRLDLTTQGGQWKSASPWLSDKFDLCLTRNAPVSPVENAGATVSFKVQVSSVVPGCADDVFTLFKVDSNTLEGMSRQGWAVRLERR